MEEDRPNLKRARPTLIKPPRVSQAKRGRPLTEEDQEVIKQLEEITQEMEEMEDIEPPEFELQEDYK